METKGTRARGGPFVSKPTGGGCAIWNAFGTAPVQPLFTLYIYGLRACSIAHGSPRADHTVIQFSHRQYTHFLREHLQHPPQVFHQGHPRSLGARSRISRAPDSSRLRCLQRCYLRDAPDVDVCDRYLSSRVSKRRPRNRIRKEVRTVHRQGRRPDLDAPWPCGCSSANQVHAR